MLLRIELLSPVERSRSAPAPGHAVGELQRHRRRSGVGRVVRGKSVMVAVTSDSVDASGGDSVDQGVALGEFFIHATASVIIWRSVAVITFWLFPNINKLFMKIILDGKRQV